MKVVLAPAEETDFEFAFEVKQQALGAYVEAHWGWDQSFQRELHRKRWIERPWSIISCDDQKVGTVSIARMANHFLFGEFYLLHRFQNRGIGTKVLQTVLQQADADGVPIRLEYLKGNPVGTLYERLGFVVVAETHHHHFLMRSPPYPDF